MGRPKLEEGRKRIKISVTINKKYLKKLDKIDLARGRAIEFLIDEYEKNNRT